MLKYMVIFYDYGLKHTNTICFVNKKKAKKCAKRHAKQCYVILTKILKDY